jgi:hypothetical protein
LTVVFASVRGPEGLSRRSSTRILGGFGKRRRRTCATPSLTKVYLSVV